MDLTTLSEGQQQQHQQQQLHHQYQQQLVASQAYDPSQIQAYDQATQAYYAYHQYDQQNSHQQYPYYAQDYTAAYQQQQSQQEPTSIQPPGVPIQPETSHLVGPEQGFVQTHVHNHQNAYYPQGVVDQQQLGSSESVVQNHQNAVVGLQEQQWQANIGGYAPVPVHGGPGSMRPPVGQSPYGDGGRRGGRPFRGGGRGHFGQHFRSDGSAPPFRGRGRGRGGGRRFPAHIATSAPAEDPAAFMQGGAPQASMPPQSALGPWQAPLPVRATPIWPPPRMAWCELCRVDCNTFEILEQHKNGKRHKKNLQIFEELQNLNKLMTGMQSEQMPVNELKPNVVQPLKVEGFEEKQAPSESLPSEPVTDDNKTDTEQQKSTMEKSEVSMAEPTDEPSRKPMMDHFEARGRGFKRKMRGGRGGKFMRTNEGPRRQVEPPKPKEVIPLICDLCNVRCDSQVVFDSHLAGKKHLSNLKRFHGYRAVEGGGLQAFYPPNPNASSTFFIPQVLQQALQGLQGLFSQPLPYMLPQAQAPALAPAAAPPPATAAASVLETQDQQDSGPQGSQAISEAAATAPVLAPAPASGLESQDQQDSNPQGSQAISEAASQNAVAVEVKNQQQFQPTVNFDTKPESGTSDFEGKEVSLPLDNSVMASLENNTVMGSKQVLSATATDKYVTIPEYEGASSDDQVVLPRLDTKMEEPESKNDEPTE